jgi:hypothetical protein
MIKLSSLEIKIADHLVKTRQQFNEAHPEWTPRMVGGDELDYQGMYGEMAYGKYHDLYFRLDHTDINNREYDYIDFLGNKIDVKAVAPGLNLIVPAHLKDFDTDIYALMWGKDDDWEYVGYTHKEHIVNDAHWDEKLPVPAYRMFINDSRFIKA